MMASNNILGPKDGKPIVTPSQDMVLGNFYLNMEETAEEFYEKADALDALGDKDTAAMWRKFGDNEGHVYKDFNEALMAYQNKEVHLHTRVALPAGSLHKTDFTEEQNNTYLVTTIGKMIFNDKFPSDFPYINDVEGDSLKKTSAKNFVPYGTDIRKYIKELKIAPEFTKKNLSKVIAEVFARYKTEGSSDVLDAIKDLGFEYSTVAGMTISLADINVAPHKQVFVEEAKAKAEVLQNLLKRGQLTLPEWEKHFSRLWADTTNAIGDDVMDNLPRKSPINMSSVSGARGNKSNFTQLAGMRGLMGRPTQSKSKKEYQPSIIEVPIYSSFREGLNVSEFFISTHGVRKGLTDTALKTAESGYLTRRLVDVAQDVVVNEEDCGTINGVDYTAIKNGDEIITPLSTRIAGHFTIERVIHPVTGELLCDVNEYISDELAKKIEESGIEKVKLRTVLTCEAEHGVCVKCYGKNLARNKLVEIGEAVGVIAAQSIGQPGTQLTMRTFHVGGTASKATEDNRIVLKYPVIVGKITGTNVPTDDGNMLFTRKGAMMVTRIIDSFKIGKNDNLAVQDGGRILKGGVLVEGKKPVLAKENGRIIILGDTLYLAGNEQKVEISNGSTVVVKEGDIIEAGKVLGTFDPSKEPIIAEVSGYVHFEDVILGSTLVEKILDNGNIERHISDLHLDAKQPRILITDEAGNELGSYFLPADAVLDVEDKQQVKAGDTLARLPVAAAKTNDITGGLPRVSELFEARKPKVPCVLAQIGGIVKFNGITKGKRIVLVEDAYGKTYEHLVPMTRRMLVRDGDTVEAGEQLCDGAPSAHDILAILGENALMDYLMSEIQSVYSAQGVAIDDKHIGVIVRQMLRKVEVVSVGDTRFIFGQQVDKYHFHEENKRVMAEGGQPAVARPMFQGITKAALATDSFISASSFQETTRVLTNAAISGATDTLHGLKENVIIGHMIPAGTGIRDYRDVKLFDDSDRDLDIQMEEIVQRRKEEQEREMALAHAVVEPPPENGYTSILQMPNNGF